MAQIRHLGYAGKPDEACGIQENQVPEVEFPVGLTSKWIS